MFLAWYLRDSDSRTLLLVAYGVGGLINHALSLAVHVRVCVCACACACACVRACAWPSGAFETARRFAVICWERTCDALVSQELSHGMMFEGGFPNELFGLLCNVPQGIPSFIVFKKCAAAPACSLSFIWSRPLHIPLL